MKIVAGILGLLLPIMLQSQAQITGVVLDEKKKPIEGANVFLVGTYDGGTTDALGMFSFSTDETGEVTLEVRFLSYETYRVTQSVSMLQSLRIHLKESVNTLDAVVVSAGTFEAGDKARVSVLKPLDIVTTAGAAGDIIGALTTLPGTQTVGEDGRLFVRGGEAGETQTFVDGVRVGQPYSPTLNGLPTRGRFSPFLFNGISFSTGGYSAEYGEALSGVLLLNTIDEPLQTQTDLSVMTVGLGVGHTVKRENNSVSANASYINLAPYQAVVPQNIDWNKPVQAFAGEAVFRQHFEKGILKAYVAFDGTQMDINQEDINAPGSIRVILNNRNFYGNTSYKEYWKNQWTFIAGWGYGISRNELALPELGLDTKEITSHLKIKLAKRFSNHIKTFFGADYFIADFNEVIRLNPEEHFSIRYRQNTGALYSETDFLLSKRLAFKAGIRGTYNELLESYRLEPRLSGAYKWNTNHQLALAYGQFTQGPLADYLKYTRELQPEKAAHYIVNYQYLKNRRIARVEAYHKEYRRLIRYDTERPEWGSVFNNEGNGYARGIDVFWRDNSSLKNTDYWVSYSWIDTRRLYRNYPETAIPGFVARHTFSIVTKHWIDSWKSQLGFSYTFNNGRPYHDPNGMGFMTGRTRPFNNLSFNWAYLLSQQKILYFSVTNLLGYNNVFGYQYASEQDSNGQFQRRAIGQPADRFFFIGFFWTISKDKMKNQLDNL